jgi:APA family basic amino acid/polyamine antiporter
MFSGEKGNPKAREIWLVDKAPVVIEKLDAAVRKLADFMQSQGLACEPEAVPQLKWLEYLVNIGAVAGLSSVVLVMLMGQPRIFYTMSRDGLLPKVFAKVHPTYQTPAASTWIVGIIALIIAGFCPLGLLGELVSGGTLAAFATVCIGVLVLRSRSPELERPFRTPWVPLVPVLGAGATMYMMYQLPALTWTLLGVWTGVGMAIYVVYGLRNSKIGRQERERGAS